ncbi:MAG: hypothetical protein AAFQ32_09480 [Pseudomonadota bacterium]
MTERWHWGEDLKTRTVILVCVRGRTSHTRDGILRDLDNGRVKECRVPDVIGGGKELIATRRKEAPDQVRGSFFTVIA